MEILMEFEDAKNEVKNIGHGIIKSVVDKYFLLDEKGKIRGSSICFIFCWGETKGGDDGKSAFNKIFGENMFNLFKNNFGYEYAKYNRYKINDKNIKNEIKQPLDESIKKYCEEENDINEIEKCKTLSDTEKETLIRARRGQGEFREGVKSLYDHCIVTGIKDLSLLIASHILPWKESDNNQRLDKYNGLLLSPHIDKLFDRHLISFNNDGSIYVKKENIKNVLVIWGINISKKYIKFYDKTKEYLKEHRKKVV